MNVLNQNSLNKKCVRSSFILLFVLLAIFAQSSSVWASDMILTISTDDTNYLAGDDIIVNGVAFFLPYVEDNEISISLINSEGTTITENIETTERMFYNTVLQAPFVAGMYEVVVTILNTTKSLNVSITVPVSVIEIAEIKTELVEDSFVVSSFGAPEDNSILTDPSMTMAKATIYTIDTNEYYMILENVTGIYDRLYIDNEPDFTGSDDDSYFVEGSTIKIADEKYSVWHIDPKGDFVIFAKRIKHVFEPPYTQTNLLLLGLDANKNPLPNQEITMDIFDAESNIELSDIVVGNTGEFGILNTQLQLLQIPGTHTMIFNDGLATESYRIEIFGLKVSVVDASGNPVYKVAPGDKIFIESSVFGQDTLIVDNIQKSEAKISGHKTLEKLTLIADTDGVFKGEYTIPTDVKGKFSVQFKFMYQDTQEVRKIRFEVENHDLTLYPISADFSPINSFAPGQESVMIISGKGTKDKKFIKLDSMTDNCNKSMFDFEAIYNLAGVDVSDNLYDISTMSDYMYDNSISNKIRNRLKNDYGDMSCVLKFNAPDTGGIYKLITSVTLDDEKRTATISFKVDDIYLEVEQISIGGVNNTILSGGRVYFKVTAKDAVTGLTIPAEKIISASIQKVTVSDTRDIVTENMTSLEVDNSYSTDTALVSFIVNDSITGYHSVELFIKVNVTRDNVEKTVSTTGYSLFREQKYKVQVNQQEQDMIYEGTTDDVAMVVNVTGVSSGEGLEVEVDKILSKTTGKKINSDASCTVGNTSSCILTIESPKAGWSSGGYSVKLIINDLKGMVEQIYGWFN